MRHYSNMIDNIYDNVLYLRYKANPFDSLFAVCEVLELKA